MSKNIELVRYLELRKPLAVVCYTFYIEIYSNFKFIWHKFIGGHVKLIHY